MIYVRLGLEICPRGHLFVAHFGPRCPTHLVHEMYLVHEIDVHVDIYLVRTSLVDQIDLCPRGHTFHFGHLCMSSSRFCRGNECPRRDFVEEMYVRVDILSTK